MRENEKTGFLKSLQVGLRKTRRGFIANVDRLLRGKAHLDEQTTEQLEEVMLAADLGFETTISLIERLRGKLPGGHENRLPVLRQLMKECIGDILGPCERPLQIGSSRPFVILTVGVNGVGKTTSIAKIAKQWKDLGCKVMLVAADTFRAAAIEQLDILGKRIGVEVVKQEHGADASAVVFDALSAAKARALDVVVVDTAGRLHTKANLMDELKKIQRVSGKVLPHAPHENLLILDATTGQNALSQARMFREAIGVTGIALTKLDGTAKGGILVAVASELGLPIRYIGIGERMEDLQVFQAGSFVEALFDTGEE